MKLGAAWVIPLEKAKMSAKCQQNAKPLSTGAEPTLELIPPCIKVSQIDKLAKFIRQCSCPKSKNVS